jgi:peptide subunit release factor 1 (eRF1)
VVDPEIVDRLLHFSREDAPVLSVYLGVPADPGELRGVESGLHSILKPARELAASQDLAHDQRESLRHDLDRVLDVAGRARELQGHGVAVFACNQADLYEEIVLPRRVRDRAVVDVTPYLRPLLAVLDESRRYCVVVVDREQAWIYEFHMGELEDASRVRGRALRKPDYAGGWQGYKEHTVHDKAQQLARQHYRDTAGRVDEMMRRTGAELLVVGGHEETVAEFRHFLPHQLQPRIAGTFVVDPGTMSPGQVRERADEVVNAYERDEEKQLVDETLERMAAGGLGAAGLEWCLMATNEHAVQLLLVHDDEQAPGQACDNCGWLGLEGEECPVCGQRTRKAADVIDEMSATVVDTSGRVEHVYADTPLAQLVVAAFLRFPVPNPTGA